MFEVRDERKNDMSDANLYSMAGEYSFYQRGEYFYSAKTNECELYQRGEYLYSFKTYECLYYIRGKHVYSMKDHQAAYYYS